MPWKNLQSLRRWNLPVHEGTLHIHSSLGAVRRDPTTTPFSAGSPEGLLGFGSTPSSSDESASAGSFVGGEAVARPLDQLLTHVPPPLAGIGCSRPAVLTAEKISRLTFLSPAYALQHDDSPLFQHTTLSFLDHLGWLAQRFLSSLFHAVGS
jgi:hypothetical protein